MAEKQLLVQLVLSAVVVSVIGNESAVETNTQETQDPLGNVVAECKKLKECENATDPWMGSVDDASLDNMCLVKCVMEKQNLIINKLIVCENLAKAVETESAKLRAMNIDINEEGWKKDSDMCCKNAVESEFTVGDEHNTRDPTEHEGLCMRAHFLWYCDFLSMARNMPAEQFKKLAEGTWKPEEAGKK